MTLQRLVHLCLLAIFVLAVLFVREKWKTEAWQANPAYTLLSIIALAVIAGIFFVVVVLPRMGDAVTTAMMSSGEEVAQDESLRSAAKVAAGDYEGAIAEYKKAIAEKPEDAFLVSEAAKVFDDKMGETEQALAFLQEHLEGREWKPDDAAYLMFRMVDVHLHAGGWEAAKEILEQVIEHFPDTKHSANATHKIRDIEQTQFQAQQSGRAKAAQQQGTGKA